MLCKNKLKKNLKIKYNYNVMCHLFFNMNCQPPENYKNYKKIGFNIRKIKI